MAWRESMFCLSLLSIALLLGFALAQPDNFVLKLINQDLVQPTFSTQPMNVHQKIDPYLQFKADANIGGQRGVVKTTSIVKDPIEGPFFMESQDISIPDRCLLLPLQSLSPNAIDSTTPYALSFSGPYAAIKSFMVQGFFPSYTMEVISKKDLFDLCFDKLNGSNKFPSITFHFTTADLVPENF